MRKNAPRKWLHAILDLLPVILIPVFMIYSHRHTIDSGSIDVPQNQVVDFNQKLFDFSDYSLHWNNHELVYGSSDDYSVYLTYPTSLVNNTLLFNCTPTLTYGHNVLVKYTIDIFNGNGNVRVRYPFIDSFSSISSGTYQLIGNVSSADYFGLQFVSSETFDFTLSYLQVFDLTQMFGSGNEPTIQQFNEWYSEPYYEYTLSHKELLKGTSTITYDDTDIMSQSMYQLYNAVDKYFNMGNVYDWFNLNIFNGNAPIIMYIVWNIALYELVMDLMFLLYALFMWFVDWCKSLIEKTYDTGRGK